jgi:DNA-binding NarL/FixJ family response regulator
MKKCIVADDHPLYRSAISQVLVASYPGVDILEAEDILSLQEVLTANQDADLVLLDLHMPGAYGFGALAFVQGLCPSIPVLVVSGNEKPEIMRKALKYGARGFLPKSSDMSVIREAIECVLSGTTWMPNDIALEDQGESSGEEQKIMEAISSLTPQQYLVLTMVAQGLLNKQIAYELDVTEATIKAHMTAIFRKLDVRSRTQAVLAVSALHLESPQNAEV